MMSRIALFAGLLVGGCGTVGEVPKDAPQLDAVSSDAPAVDATPAGDAPVSPDGPSAACDPSKPFAPAIEVPGVHQVGVNDVHASLTDDELTIYFGSNRFDPTSSTMHIYSATRATRDAAFTTATLLGSISATEGESNPSISPDGNTIYFDSRRSSPSGPGDHIFTSTRLNATVVFPTATVIAGDFLISPSITADGKVLYAADLTSGALARLDRVGGGFGAAQPVALQTTMSVTAPVSRDDLTMFLSIGDTIGNDIIVTKRASTIKPFPAPTEVTEIKTNATVAEPSWISADGCRLYLRYAASGDASRIYVATRPK
jgi:WD40-like Beta Propeller Repeat